MLRVGLKSVFALFVVFTLYTCIDPYAPKLKGYESLLVVDGLITDDISTYKIKLSRTIQEQDAIPEEITGATVYITDDNGTNTFLSDKGNGIYYSDSTEFNGIIGKTYVLHILMDDGNEYESEPCYMQSVPEIDSLYYIVDQELINNGTEKVDGIRIFLDSEEGGDNRYYKWNFEETWKFKVPTPKKYNYIDTATIIPVEKINEFCWKTRESDDILIHSAYSGQQSQILQKPIFFIGAEKSDRLLIKYSMLVSQYSISKKEFDFWNNLKRVNETGADIFATQPFPVISNIHNLNNPEEQVLGYFQVSAVKQKRIYISFNEIQELNLPFYHYPCERLELAPEDIPMPTYAPPLTWDELYRIFCVTSDYYFVEPKYKGVDVLEKMVFAQPECADCEIDGSSQKPDFWID